MSIYKRRRSALLNVIQGLEDSDFVSEDVLELDEIQETMPEEMNQSQEQIEDSMLPQDQDEDTIISDQQLEQVLASLDDEQVQCKDQKVASEETPGIQDQIEDTANGGDPTTSEIAPGGEEAKKEVSTDGQVFPTNSEYVAEVVEKLDDIACALQKMGMTKLAFRIDTISDKLELSKRK